MTLNDFECHDAPKKSRFADEIGERYREIGSRGGKVLQRWRGSGGHVRLSHLLMSFLSFNSRCRLDSD